MTALSGREIVPPAVKGEERVTPRPESALSTEELIRLYRERVVRDKSYQALPLGGDVAEYLRHKRKRLTKASFKEYESCLYWLAQAYGDLRVEDFEPPVGTQRLEEWLDEKWGERKARTYNKNLSILGDFFDFWVKRGRLHGDPTTPIDRAKERGVERTTFTPAQIRAILAEQDDLRDKLGLRLLLDYGLRKGSLQAVRFKHFDHVRKRLTVFGKGGKVRTLPLPDPAFWHDLGRLIIDTEAKPDHFLLHRSVGRAKKPLLDQPMGVHGMHHWWYRCLSKAGIVPEGTTSGEKMHKARHTAGQRLLDHTGNLEAVKKLLGHASIKTTSDVYLDWDEDRLTESLSYLKDEE